MIYNCDILKPKHFENKHPQNYLKVLIRFKYQCSKSCILKVFVSKSLTKDILVKIFTNPEHKILEKNGQEVNNRN